MFVWSNEVKGNEICNQTDNQKREEKAEGEEGKEKHEVYNSLQIASN